MKKQMRTKKFAVLVILTWFILMIGINAMISFGMTPGTSDLLYYGSCVALFGYSIYNRFNYTKEELPEE